MTVDDEIKAARNALAQGDFALARHHLDNAHGLGLTVDRADPLFRLLDDQERIAIHQHVGRVVYGFAAAALLYGGLSFVDPRSMSPAVLALLRLLVIPAVCGVFAGHSVFSEDGKPTRSHRFARGFAVAGLAMGFCALASMISIHGQIESDQTGSAPIVIFTVALCMGAVAGLSGGIFAILGKAN